MSSRTPELGTLVTLLEELNEQLLRVEDRLEQRLDDLEAPREAQAALRRQRLRIVAEGREDDA